MKKFAAVFICLLLGTAVFSFADSQGDNFELAEPAESQPIWQTLENLSKYEKENAIIEIECEAEASSQAALVEGEWNSGNYEEAIELLKNSPNLENVAIGIQWREPVITSKKRWGNDVRIGDRDSIKVVALDVDNSNGNLLVVLQFEQGGNSYWSVNLSSDTGRTWAETYDWHSIVSNGVVDVDAVVLDSFFYVGYALANDNTGRIRRFDTESGDVDSDYSYLRIIDEGVPLRDIALACNEDYLQDRIYYWAIMDNDSLSYYWSDADAESWDGLYKPDVDNASRGLDVCYDLQTGGNAFEFVSYIGTDDSLYALERPFVYHGPLDYVGDNPSAKTSVSAYKDTVIITFPQYVPDSLAYEMRYRVSYDDGDYWYWGRLAYATVNFFMSDVTGRNGDGFGVVYQSAGTSAEGFFRHRGYPVSPSWSTPVSFADSIPRASVKPSVERIADGIYGIVYVNWHSISYPQQIALFDRSDWVMSGIKEEENVPDENVMSITGVNPSVFSSSTDIKYYLPSARGNVTLEIYDALGRKVKTLVKGTLSAGTHSVTWNGEDEDGNPLSGGIYFSVLKSDNVRETSKLTLIR